MRLRYLTTPLITASVVAFATPMLAVAQVATGQQAATPDEAGASAATAVPQVVVTANRAPTQAVQVGQSFTVLTAIQLQQDQETNISEILARTPGSVSPATAGRARPPHYSFGGLTRTRQWCWSMG